LINDINKVFGVKSECFLELDLSSYNDLSSLTNLIGSSKGYVGYEQGGVLFEHIIKYPLSVVYFKNFKDAHYSIRNYLTKLIKKTFVYDNKGRKIFFSNTIFIFDQITFCKKHLGFENKENLLEDSLFDIVLHNLDENCIINK
jgi:ATP-dependent Clp protease ATP-binding subunit ClpA